MKRKILFLVAVFTLAFVANVFASDIPELPKIPEDIKLEDNWNKIADKYKRNLLSSRRLYSNQMFTPYEFVLGIKYDDLYANIFVYTDAVKAKVIGIDYTLFYREKDFQSNKKEIQKAFNNLKKEYCKEFGVPEGLSSVVDGRYCVDVRSYNTSKDNNSSSYKGIRFFATKRYGGFFIPEIKKDFDLNVDKKFAFMNILESEKDGEE